MGDALGEGLTRVLLQIAIPFVAVFLCAFIVVFFTLISSFRNNKDTLQPHKPIRFSYIFALLASLFVGIVAVVMFFFSR